jgi:hypothetical protein
MQKRTGLCMVLTVYDVFRWLLMTGMLLVVAGAPTRGIVIGGAGNSLNSIPFLVYAAAPMIFPLMAFFLWQNKAVYRPFSYLYIAGKLISIVAVFVWCFSTWRLNGLIFLIRFSSRQDVLFQLVVPFFSLLDVFSVLGIFTVLKKE